MHDVRRKMDKFIRTLWKHDNATAHRSVVLRECYMDFTAGELTALADTLYQAGGLTINRDKNGFAIYTLASEIRDVLKQEAIDGHRDPGGSM